MFDRIFRNPETGQVVIAQAPNLPLIIFLVASVVRLVFPAAGIVAAIALAWWSVAEIGWGDSLFRRFLGAAVLVGMVVGRVL